MVHNLPPHTRIHWSILAQVNGKFEFIKKNPRFFYTTCQIWRLESIHFPSYVYATMYDNDINVFLTSWRKQKEAKAKGEAKGGEQELRRLCLWTWNFILSSLDMYIIPCWPSFWFIIMCYHTGEWWLSISYLFFFFCAQIESFFSKYK